MTRRANILFAQYIPLDPKSKPGLCHLYYNANLLREFLDHKLSMVVRIPSLLRQTHIVARLRRALGIGRDDVDFLVVRLRQSKGDQRLMEYEIIVG